MDTLIQVGLTGGIASGKTEAAAMFAKHGARVIDTDALAHQTLAPRTATHEAVVRAFGRDILNGDGTVNRARLGDIVFADARQRQRLNAIVHPAVRAAWLGQLDQWRRAGDSGVAMVIVPLLYEVGVQDQFAAVVVVACSEAMQRRRLRGRGLSDAQVQGRLAVQWPLATKMERADFVMWNESPLAVLEQQVALVWNRLTSAPLA
jgi:dephospho-CoA kinase